MGKWLRTTWARRTSGSGHRDDTGAALVEMAIVFPLLILLIIGIFEVGGAFKDVLTTSNAVRDGTRLLSAKGNDPLADCEALTAAEEGLKLAANFDALQEIQIFKSDLAGDPVAGYVNRYRYDEGDITPPCMNWEEVALPWDPVTRDVFVGTTPLDVVGMRIIYEHDWYTGFPPFSGSFTIDEQTITRLEPEGYESP